jgi:hypothetical protein
LNVQGWLGKDNQLGIDIWTKKYQYENETFEEWLDRVSGGNDAIRRLIKEKKFLFGGRILANRNIPGNKTYSNCYVITPVCSQTRDFSSLVVSKDEKVTLKVKEASTECFLTIDGRELYPLTKGDVVMVEQSEYTLNIVNFYRQASIYETVYKVMSSNKKADE